jgi:hypothetical protein
MRAKYYARLFQNRYPALKGRDWLRHVDPDDRKAFSLVGIAHRKAGYGKQGGKTNIQKARRDSKGRFVKHSVRDTP